VDGVPPTRHPTRSMVGHSSKTPGLMGDRYIGPWRDSQGEA